MLFPFLSSMYLFIINIFIPPLLIENYRDNIDLTQKNKFFKTLLYYREYYDIIFRKNALIRLFKDV